jgi:hypothetical protein
MRPRLGLRISAVAWPWADGPNLMKKNDSSRRGSAVPRVAKGNIEAIMHIEQDFLRQRSMVDRVSDMVSRLAGSIGFVIFHVLSLPLGYCSMSTSFPDWRRSTHFRSVCCHFFFPSKRSSFPRSS